MKLLLMISSLLVCLYSCTSTSSTLQNNNTETLKENQYKALVLELPMKTSTGLDHSKKEIFLKVNGQHYVVKISEGYVTKNEFLKHLGQEVVIKGEIKIRETKYSKPESIIGAKQPEQERQGPYMVVYKIYKNK